MLNSAGHQGRINKFHKINRLQIFPRMRADIMANVAAAVDATPVIVTTFAR